MNTKKKRLLWSHRKYVHKPCMITVSEGGLSAPIHRVLRSLVPASYEPTPYEPAFHRRFAPLGDRKHSHIIRRGYHFPYIRWEHLSQE